MASTGQAAKTGTAGKKPPPEKGKLLNLIVKSGPGPVHKIYEANKKRKRYVFQQ